MRIESTTPTTPEIPRISKISYATFLFAVGALLLCVVCGLSGCNASDSDAAEDSGEQTSLSEVNDISFDSEKDSIMAQEIQPIEEEDTQQADDEKASDENTEEANADTEDATNNDESAEESSEAEQSSSQNSDTIRSALSISEDYRSSFVHGDKSAQYQKYIVLHDTEVNNDANAIVSNWDEDGDGIAAHFIVNKDGSIVQCVPLDKITHHAGYGNAGYNDDYGVQEDGRDDMVGSTSIGSSYPDYGMNAYSIGIELVHVEGSGDYPEAQLNALDNLIAYIDTYYQEQGYDNGGKIIDHKMWRTTNPDTSAEFAGYLDSYKSIRKHA